MVKQKEEDKEANPDMTLYDWPLRWLNQGWQHPIPVYLIAQIEGVAWVSTINSRQTGISRDCLREVYIYNLFKTELEAVENQVEAARELENVYSNALRRLSLLLDKKIKSKK